MNSFFSKKKPDAAHALVACAHSQCEKIGHQATRDPGYKLKLDIKAMEMSPEKNRQISC